MHQSCNKFSFACNHFMVLSFKKKFFKFKLETWFVTFSGCIIQLIFVHFTMQAVADIICTTLGPRSMLKMLLDAGGGASWILDFLILYISIIELSVNWNYQERIYLVCSKTWLFFLHANFILCCIKVPWPACVLPLVKAGLQMLTHCLVL